MNYSKRDVVIGFVIIILIVLGAFYYKKINNPFKKISSSPTPVSIYFKDEFENSFKYDIPEDRNSIELKDVTGGNGRGIATKNEILADIEDPAANYFYQAWLENDGKLVLLGKLQAVKGGWLIEYNKPEYFEYQKDRTIGSVLLIRW